MNKSENCQESYPLLIRLLLRLLDVSWVLPDDQQFRASYGKLVAVREKARRAEIALLQSDAEVAFSALVESCREFLSYTEGLEVEELPESPEIDNAAERYSSFNPLHLQTVQALASQGGEGLSEFGAEELVEGGVSAIIELERVERTRLFEDVRGVYKGFAKLLTGAGTLVLGCATLFFLYQVLKPKKEWRVEYFEGKELNRSVRVSEADEINFHWDHNAPAPGVGADNFSATYQSCLRLSADADVKFELGSDDGSRFFVKGKKIIDRWAPNPYSVSDATERLTAGSYPLRIDYFEEGGGAVLTFAMYINGVLLSDSNEAVLLPVVESKTGIHCAP